MELHCNLVLAVEAWALAQAESTLGYHSCFYVILTGALDGC